MNEERHTYKVQIIVAVIGLTGVLGTAIFANWDKIFQNNNGNPPVRIQQEDKTPKAMTSGIAGRYTMDKQNSRIIILSRLVGNEYRIEEITSPWPWTGTAKLDGSKLSGRAHFPKSQATMKVEGSLRGDGSIDVSYHFITKGDGSLAEGRVDHHVWFPE
jgi:hypothetical protein